MNRENRIPQLALWTLAGTVIAYPYFRGSWVPPRSSAAQTDASATSLPNRQALTVDGYLTLSYEYMKAGRYQEAVDASREALKLRPDLAIAYSNIGAAYGQMALWDEAIGNTERAMQLDPAMKATFQGNLNVMIDERNKVLAKVAATGQSTPR